MCLDLVGRDTFYGLLASLRGRLVCDADFAELCCLENSGTCLPAMALLLRTYDKVSDAEAKADSDILVEGSPGDRD